MTTLADERQLVVDFIRQQLQGPAEGPHERILERPDRRYIVGLLHQRQLKVDEGTQESEILEGAGSTEEEGGVADDPVQLANQLMPSSVGLSAYVETSKIRVGLTAARYVHQEDRSWIRRDLCRAGEGVDSQARAWEEVSLPDRRKTISLTVLEGAARLDVLSRPLGTGRLITVTLMNDAEAVSGFPDAAQALCQVGIRLEPVDGVIREYPDVRTVSLDQEEQELTVTYRDRRTYAIGHGCAADWSLKGDLAGAVWTEFLPATETPQLVPREEERSVLRLRHLIHAPREQLVEQLTEFVDDYERWIGDLAGKHLDIPQRLIAARERILARLTDTVTRLRSGVRLLATGPDEVIESFRLANRTMLLAMRHGRSDRAGSRHKPGKPEADEVPASFQPAWRPFQLAFQLLALPGLADPEHEDRELVDLLWFPTGGGKTEAYLALAAFTIFRSRLRDPKGRRGTQILTRYTLRLLTAQQFQRAATMICAAEVIRAGDPDRLGSDEVSIGLWVGMGSTPLDRQGASEALKELMESPERGSPFQIDRCPWCGTALIPDEPSTDPNHYGFVCLPGEFLIRCRDDRCRFSERLPAQVIDEELYRRPPTMLIGTVDKFARLAWVAEAGVFLGNGSAPPELIIQDELHLLSGPLGTMVGLYEAALGAVIEHHGGKPKILSSTATIRRADQQTRGLFARPTRVFPPSGLTADDSYFMKRDDAAPGRVYLGVMSQSETPTYSLVHTAAAAAEAPSALTERLSTSLEDSYRTLIIYHNSLRELGKTMTLAADDIPARVGVITADQAKARRLEAVEELTSNVPAERLPEILEAMAIPSGQPGSLDLVACTNMLSVGVDVPRLGVMIVHGQPKTTSEYIQATSRVGRDVRIAPGLVVAHYSANKPRDRSHYEQFRTYHQGLYRYVEPTSVTPFALPARDRALHAALVILVRHALGLGENADAARFQSSLPRLRDAVERLVDAAEIGDPDEVDATRTHLRQLIDEWEAKAMGGPLRYRSGNRVTPGLLVDFGSSGQGWPTLHSMRNVDRTCTIRIKDVRTA